MKIEEEFNGTNAQEFRSAVTLRKKYENIKKRTKQEFADEKCYVKDTGGGPPRDIQFDEIDFEVKEILGARIDGLPSEFDDDVIQPEETEESDIFLQVPVPNVTEDLPILHTSRAQQDHSYTKEKYGLSSCGLQPKKIFENSSSNIVSESTSKKRGYNYSPTNIHWSTYNSEKLKTKKSKVLKTSEKPARRTEITSKVSQWAEAKTELEQYKKACMDKENELKLQLMQEKQVRELKLMEEESAAKISLLKAEHKFKLKFHLIKEHSNLTKEQLEILFSKLYSE